MEFVWRLRPLKKQRLEFNKMPYTNFIADQYKEMVKKSQESASLYELVESWLERTPFLSIAGFDFWKEYKKATHQMFANDRKHVEENTVDVGTEFATEARKIADGDAPDRAIRGEAKLEEAKALIEDGIPVAPLPWGKKARN